MNIKKIIDAERWHDHDGAIVPMISGFDLNRRLDRIEAEANNLTFPTAKRIWVEEEGSIRIDFTGNWHIAMRDGQLSQLIKETTDPLHKRIAELEAELKPVVKQYYYRVSGCKATHATDPDCICWHDKGTGPMTGYEETSTLEWRTKPNPDKQRIAELEEQNLNMMALFRDFYDLEFNRDECWEIIKKYGGDA